MAHRIRNLTVTLTPLFLTLTAGINAHAEALFEDVSQTSGVDFRHQAGMTGDYHFVEIMGPGVALFDYDGDGDLDLWLGQGYDPGKGNAENASDQLYRNDSETGNVRFVNVTRASGIHATGYAMGAATGDYDNDGDVDLLVTNWGPNELWRNNGDGTFSNVALQAGVTSDRWSTSAAFVDLNRDGWLDLYVANYAIYDLNRHKQCFAPSGVLDYCGPNSYPPDADHVYLNQKNGTFKEVQPGIIPSTGLGVAAADFNGDGWQDLYIANDQKDNFLLINNQSGGVLDDALLAGAAVNARGKAESSMGIAVADYDDDGDFDLFLTHLNTETNTLYRNLGGGLFEDASDATGIAAPSWRFTGFGTVFADFDLDGDLDLYVANGEVRRLSEQMESDEAMPFRQPDQLFLNNGEGQFSDASERLPQRELVGIGRGVAVGDLDNDGAPDLVIANTNESPTLLRAVPSKTARWIGLNLRSGGSSAGAVGAVVRLSLENDRILTRHVHSDGSFLSARDPRIRFGLPSGTTPKALSVLWPDGSRSSHAVPELNRYTSIEKPTSKAEESQD